MRNPVWILLFRCHCHAALAPLHLPTGSDIESGTAKKSTLTSSPIIRVFVLGRRRKWYISTKQFHLTPLSPLLCPISSTFHVQISVLNSESVDIHSPSLHVTLRIRSPHPSRAPDACSFQKGVASQAITLFSSSQIPNGFHNQEFTRFDSGRQPYNSRVASGSRRSCVSVQRNTTPSPTCPDRQSRLSVVVS